MGRVKRRPQTAAQETLKTAQSQLAGSPAKSDLPQASVSSRPGAFTRGDIMVVLGLALLIVISYWPALAGGFVWDDVAFSEEKTIHQWSGLWKIWFAPSAIGNEGHYWPITYTTFWLEHKLWGLEPLGYHLVNVLLHVANTVLLWRLMLRFLVPGALAIAALFAVHPLHVESVAWIIERKDLLSALFYLSAVFMWVRFTEAPHPGRYCAALVLFVAGMLSKSITVTLPAALLIWHWWLYGRISRYDVLRLAPFFLVGLAVTAADLMYYTSRESLALGYSFAERILIAARALWFYVGKLLWPTDLMVIYPLWKIQAGNLLGWLYVAAAVGLTAALWFLRQYLGRGPLASVLFFVVTLSPVLGFIDYGYMKFSFVADRFQYLAGIGLMALLVGSATLGASRLPDMLRHIVTGMFVSVLVVLAALSWQQSKIYRDEVTFFSHIAEHNPAAHDVYINLGNSLFRAGRTEEAYAASLAAVEYRPGSAKAHTNLGYALLSMERLDKAQVHLSRALELNPRNIFARQNMAQLKRQQGRHEEAVEQFSEILEKNPSNARVHAGLGLSLYDLGRHEEAIASMERALELEPQSDNAPALHAFIGRALQALGQLEEAEQQLLHAMQLLPDDAKLLIDLSSLRTEQQRFDEADEYLQQALAIAPADTNVLQYMAGRLNNQGRHEQAIESYRAVLAIDPEFAMAYAGMGHALYKLERYEEAIESFDRSLQLHSHPPTATARLILMGKASEKLGRAGMAVKHYEHAVEIDPKNAEALDHLAMTRFTGKRYDEALALYQAMLEIRPESPQIHSNLGATLVYLDRPEEALTSFERALVLDPEFEVARKSIERLRRSLDRKSAE